MPYIPNTDNELRQMLADTDISDLNQLLSCIPQDLRLKRTLDIPAMSEMEVLRDIANLAADNRERLICFAGGGVYDHFIPAAIGAIINRPEFMTAYTPYQPEVAQGTLQVIYEFQTHICRLTGMDVANASMYDGATAAAEAALLTCRVTKRDRVIVLETVNPFYREVIKTYLEGQGIRLITVPMKDGLGDMDRLGEVVDDKIAGVIVNQPNFFGILEDGEIAVEIAHRTGAKLVAVVDPVAQAILRTPSEWGADIVVGEGQPLGIPLSFGGPLLGFFAARKELVRYIPGRIVARTTDAEGHTGFVLTLQTREQHIRRERATSNICTNEALCATTAAVYMTLLGRTGLREVALLSTERARETSRKIFELDGFEPYYSTDFVREFAVRTPLPAKEIINAMVERNILPGIDAGRWFEGMHDCLIIAATEKRTNDDIDILVEGLKEVTHSHALSRM
ncbi:MAG: aminomethyl-transferring glycine dehydrogenase subunit GcvPA [candidate division Zixibacteria bacterium]|nr:aminomethyl-transferring glycine dehydrogenase subunit GcvPA [candidate division Zixibacteria bacterium]